MVISCLLLSPWSTKLQVTLICTLFLVEGHEDNVCPPWRLKRCQQHPISWILELAGDSNWIALALVYHKHWRGPVLINSLLSVAAENSCFVYRFYNMIGISQNPTLKCWERWDYLKSELFLSNYYNYQICNTLPKIKFRGIINRPKVSQFFLQILVVTLIIRTEILICVIQNIMKNTFLNH